MAERLPRKTADTDPSLRAGDRAEQPPPSRQVAPETAQRLGWAAISAQREADREQAARAAQPAGRLAIGGQQAADRGEQVAKAAKPAGRLATRAATRPDR
jgi:hypothetical protein